MTKSRFDFKLFSITQEFSALKLGTDSVLLGAHSIFSNPNKILDIGTGTGILALMMAQKHICPIYAIDIDEGAIQDATINFNKSIWNERIQCEYISLQNFASKTTMQFDGIICNPPYFSNSLLSNKNNKNIARHTVSLGPIELFQNTKRLLSLDGIFSIIIPTLEKSVFIKAAIDSDFYLVKEIEIQPFYDSAANRTILHFCLTWKSFTKENLAIRKDKLTYTTEFKEITKEFYLNN